MIRLVPVANNDDKVMSYIRQIYDESFPIDERRDFNEVKVLLQSRAEFVLYLIESDGKEVGFISSWEFPDFIYVEHFAIDPSCRGGGYGAETLQCFLSDVTKPVVLEVERPEDDFSRRRIAFYERVGFKLWGEIAYIQPPYDTTRKPLDLLLMTFGDIDLSSTFKLVNTTLHREVYGVKE